jgi:hypothetical protein
MTMPQVMMPRRSSARAARPEPILDRLFEGGCTALFLVLLVAVVQAAWPYLH